MGEFFKYPICCIEELIEDSKLPTTLLESQREDFKGHIAKGSGFVPCKKCRDFTRQMTPSEFITWLTRDPWITLPLSVIKNDKYFLEIEKKWLNRLEGDYYGSNSIR